MGSRSRSRRWWSTCRRSGCRRSDSETRMWMSVQAVLAEKLLGLWSSLYPGLLLMVAACTAISLFSGQACNPGKVWWRNRGLFVDVCYWLALQCIGPYFRTGLLIGIATLATAFASPAEIEAYVHNGRGPVSGLSFWSQAA